VRSVSELLVQSVQVRLLMSTPPRLRGIIFNVAVVVTFDEATHSGVTCHGRESTYLSKKPLTIGQPAALAAGDHLLALISVLMIRLA